MAAAGVEYRCFVGGLAWATNNESLEHAFASYGEILDSKVCFVSFSLGFILVSFSLGFIPWSLCAAVMLDPCRGSIDLPWFGLDLRSLQSNIQSDAAGST